MSANGISPKLAEEIEAFKRYLVECEKSGWRKKPKPEVVPGPWPRKTLTQEELWRRQKQIDAYWERHLAEKAEREEEARKSCNRGPGDPDYVEDPLRSMIWGGRSSD